MLKRATLAVENGRYDADVVSSTSNTLSNETLPPFCAHSSNRGANERLEADTFSSRTRKPSKKLLKKRRLEESRMKLLTG